jgi:hypothetical protein
MQGHMNVKIVIEVSEKPVFSTKWCQVKDIYGLYLVTSKGYCCAD